MIAALFRLLAALRRARAFHPTGRTYRGTGSFDGGEPGPVLVRLSRGAGLPQPLPDLHGVAVRWVDRHGPGRHQDLLLTSVWRRSRIPRPTRWFHRGGFSTIAPYRRPDGSTVVLRCGPVRAGRIAIDDGERAVASAQIADDHDGEVRFDPWNTGDGLVPTGWINRLRRPAYVGSRRGFSAGRPGSPRTAR